MRCFCASACPILLPLCAGASDSNKPLTQYTHTVWTRKDGIPAAFIYSLAQTQDGYLWLATTDGLVRFDGRPFRPLASNDRPHRTSGRGAEAVCGTRWTQL